MFSCINWFQILLVILFYIVDENLLKEFNFVPSILWGCLREFSNTITITINIRFGYIKQISKDSNKKY